MVNKFAAIFIATCMAAPSEGYSLFRKEVARQEESSPSSFYGALTPSAHLRHQIVAGTGRMVVSGTSVLSINDFGRSTIGAGAGLDLEFGWKDCLRFTGRSLAGGGQRAGSAGFMTKNQVFDADGAVTLFAPMNPSCSLLLTGGWEYKWARIRGLKGGTDTPYTAGILWINGPFVGFGLSLKPSNRLKIESGLSYHIPQARAAIRAPYLDTFNGTTEWLPVTRYRAGRFGLGGYLSANWQTSEHWSVNFSIEGVSLVARGDNLGAGTPAMAEQFSNVMQWTYIDYSFGLKYQF